jgi:hypothetical protein
VIKKIILVGGVFDSVIPFLKVCNARHIKIEPEIVGSIPRDTKWIGGADGGSWSKIIKVVAKNTFKIQIYNDNNGELITDATFMLNPDCILGDRDSSTLLKEIDFF